MRRTFTILGILLCVVCAPQRSVAAASNKCIVIRKISGCDYFMVQTTTSYAVLEWFGGHEPEKDDKIYGDLHYGIKTFAYEDGDRTVRVFVEEYGLSKEDGLDKLVEHCE